MDRHNFTARAWVPLMQRARLPAMRFHDLRHTAAMHLLEDGVPIHAVSRLLGHASVAITVGMYEYPTAQMSDAAVKAMEARYPT